jgi:predicted DNA-binding protein
MKPTHGGKRPGAGRKPGNPRQSLTIRLSEPAMAKLHKLRETTGTSAGRLIEEMILNHTKDHEDH